MGTQTHTHFLMTRTCLAPSDRERSEQPEVLMENDGTWREKQKSDTAVCCETRRATFKTPVLPYLLPLCHFVGNLETTLSDRFSDSEGFQ